MKLYFIAFVVLLCSSCSDFLDEDHPTEITDENFWKTMNECEEAFKECKLWLKGGHGGQEISVLFLEGATDNMYFQSNFEQRIVNLGNGSLIPPTEANKPSAWEDTFNSWQNYYTYIRRVNRFLKHVDNAYFSDESERTRLKAEARVWRAWYHIRLLNWYGRHDGVPIIDVDLESNEINKPRNTVEECLNYINTELDQIINSSDLPFLWDEGRRDRMSRSIALTLKMDINLQFKNYEIAKEAAWKIIESGEFELYYSTKKDDDLGRNYRDLFNYEGEQNKERILFRKEGLNDIWFRMMGTPLGGQGVGAVLKSMVDEYETIDGKTLKSLPAEERVRFEKNPLYKARDPRLYATVMIPGDNTSVSNYKYEPFDEEGSDYVGKTGASRSGYMLKKYTDENDRATGSGTLDFTLYRYAEVLLDYVECLIETGQWNDPKVEEYINLIRVRAGMPTMDKTIYNSEDKVRELYRRERRVELAYEGKRYDDIRRWAIGSEVMTGTIYGAWNPNSNSYVNIETRNCIFPKYDSWPLPQQETTANKNITQPKGW